MDSQRTKCSTLSESCPLYVPVSWSIPYHAFVSQLNGLTDFAIDQHPAMKRAVTDLQKRSSETTFICLSNSNEIYIDTILKVSTSSLYRLIPDVRLTFTSTSTSFRPRSTTASPPSSRRSSPTQPTGLLRTRATVSSSVDSFPKTPPINIRVKSVVLSICARGTSWRGGCRREGGSRRLTRLCMSGMGGTTFAHC